MRSSQRITVVLHIDIEETQASDVHDIVHLSKDLANAVDHLDYVGLRFVRDLNDTRGESASHQVHIEHTTRYIP